MADNPLQPIAAGWMKKLTAALGQKRKEFGEDAEECMRFFTGPYSWMYNRRRGKQHDPDNDFDMDAGEDEMPAPTFRMSVNKTAEVVELFGPVLYQRNPDRKVTARRAWLPPISLFGGDDDPVAQQQFLGLKEQAQPTRGQDEARGSLFESYLNFTPAEMGLRDHSRRVVDEALIKGMGTWWTEEEMTPDGRKLVGSFFDTVDNLLLDPDARCWHDLLWVARRCVHPVWEVEDEYGLPRGTLKGGNAESLNRVAETAGQIEESYKRAQGGSNDLLVYWKVYSKMGLGGRLAGVMDSAKGYSDELDQEFGDYCFLAVTDACDYPLNLPPSLLDGDEEQIKQAAQWPVPFWLHGDWPVTPLAFHWVPGHLWPMSHLKPGLGELKAINWIFSMMVSKIRIASRDFVAILKASNTEIKEAIKHGADYTLIELEQINGSIDNVVKFLQHPGFNPEIYKVLDHLMELFDKRVGLTDLVYGQTQTQMRSAEEARVKQSQTSIRPQDMAEQVEDASSELARREMSAARWLLQAEDVAPILGPVGAFFWRQLVETHDPATIFHAYECRIESGSTKRPDKARDQAALQDSMQQLLQPLYSYAQATGDVQPVNALIAAWGKSIGLESIEDFLLKPPPPPAPVTGSGNGPPGAGSASAGGGGPPNQPAQPAQPKGT